MKNIKNILIALSLTLCIASLSGKLTISSQEQIDLDNVIQEVDVLEGDNDDKLEKEDEEIEEVDEDLEVNKEVDEELEVNKEVEEEKEVKLEKKEEKKKVKTNEAFLPKYTISSNKNTIRPNPTDQYDIHISDLGFKLEEGQTASHYDMEIWTEYYFESMELQSIEIPYITAKDVDGNDLYVDVYFMTLTGGRLWIEDPVRITETNQGHVITRSEILEYLKQYDLPEFEDGKWPIKTYLLIQSVPKDLEIPPEEVAWENVHPNEMTFHGDVVYSYEANGKTPYYDSYYEVFSLETDLTVDPGYIEHIKEVDYYLYYETSDLTITSDKTKDLSPGDEIELTFTINNTSDIDNILTGSLDVEGLELVPGSLSSEIDLSKWKITDTGFDLSILDLANEWIKIPRNSSFTFKQKFKIKEDFDLNSILIKPALSAANRTYEKDYNETLELNLKQDKQEGKVIVNYVDVDNNVLQAPTILTGMVNDAFKIDILTLEGYTYKETLNNTKTRMIEGIFTQEDQEYTLIYTKDSEGEVPVVPEKPSAPSKPNTPDTGVYNTVLPLLSVMLISIILLKQLKKRKYL